MYNPYCLSDKTILVTGASSGIGRSVAIECSKLGARLVITGRNRERLDETLCKLEGEGHKSVVADLCAETGLSELVDKIEKVDGIVHCAGINNNIPFSFVKRESLEEIMGVNFMAPAVLSAQIVKKKKINKNGSIIFISSISGVLCSAPASSMYSASKGAINGIAKGMALDLAPRGIRVNCINPGVVDTNIFEKGQITEEQLEENRKLYPLRRFGQPKDIALAVIYLLSDASSWVTGSNLIIDGGLTLI